MITLIAIIFILLLGHYVYFLLKILSGLEKLTIPDGEGKSEDFISVIIPFRNEAENILKSIESIENLDYPEDKFEVIYVDDNSTDNSYDLAEQNRKKSNIKLIRLPDEIPSKGNKKRAIEYGIQKSRGDIIVTTDADCIHQKSWLRRLEACFDSDTGFVSAPVEMKSSPGIFAGIQQTEFKGLILAGAGLIGSGNPVICNGANIAYKKSAFQKAGGYGDNLNLSSGDDEFLMRKISDLPEYKIKFCNSRDAAVFTEPEKGITGFFNQRKRWAGKITHYENRSLILALFFIFLFYLSLIIQAVLAVLGYSFFLLLFLFSVLIKFTLEFMIIKKGDVLFTSRNSNLLFLITEIIHIPYIIITAVAAAFGRFTWKDRKIKF